MEEEISLHEIYRILRKRVWSILVIIGLISLGATVYYLLASRIYRAEAVILPLGGQGPGFSSTGLSVFSALPLFTGLFSPSSGKIELLLKSRSLAEKVVTSFDLQKVYFKDLWDDQLKRWKVENPHIPTVEDAAYVFLGSLKVVPNVKYSSLHVRVESEDAELATKLANGVLEELQKYINDSAFSEAKKQRIYIGEQLLANRRALLEAGKKIAAYFKENQISPVFSVVDVPLTLDFPAAEDIEKQPDSEVQLERQIGKLMQEKEESKKRLDEGFVRKVPQQVYLEYLHQHRTILNGLNGLLSQRYESAKMTEAMEELSFQVIDEARIPKSPYKPDKRRIQIVALLASLLLGLLYAFLAEYVGPVWGRKVFFKRRVGEGPE